MPESASGGGGAVLSPSRGGVLSPGKGVYLVPGVYLVLGGVWSRGTCLVPGGCLLQGVCVPAPGGGGVVSQHALRQTPPCEQNDRQV